LADILTAIRTLSRLRAQGMRVSIDDFGTGYSSLGYLARIPVDTIKIDRLFVQDMESNHQNAAIVRAFIALGHRLGLSVVADGVEDKQTHVGLLLLGCDGAQGYFIAPPMPAPECAHWFIRMRSTP
jgi:diguanylate cyclase